MEGKYIQEKKLWETQSKRGRAGERKEKQRGRRREVGERRMRD